MVMFPDKYESSSNVGIDGASRHDLGVLTASADLIVLICGLRPFSRDVW